MQKIINGGEEKDWDWDFGVGVWVGKLGLRLVCPDCLYNCLSGAEIYVAYNADPII